MIVCDSGADDVAFLPVDQSKTPAAMHRTRLRLGYMTVRGKSIRRTRRMTRGETVGMFDTVRCRYPLPRHQNSEFQTKDLELVAFDESGEGTLSLYEITEDGRLRRRAHRYRIVRKQPEFQRVVLKSTNTWWEDVPDAHGDVFIYTFERSADAKVTAKSGFACALRTVAFRTWERLSLGGFGFRPYAGSPRLRRPDARNRSRPPAAKRVDIRGAQQDRVLRIPH